MEEDAPMQVNHLFNTKSKKKRLKAWSGMLISPLLTFMEEGIAGGRNYNREVMRGESEPKGKRENKERVEVAVKLLGLLGKIVNDDERMEIIRRKRGLDENDVTIIYPTLAFMPAVYDSENLIKLGVSLRNTSEYVKEYMRIIKYSLDRYDNYIKAGLPDIEATDRKRRILGSNCLVCGTSYSLTEHHIVPRRFSGTSHRNNLAVLCRDCHNGAEGLEKIINMYEKAANLYGAYFEGEEIAFIFHNTRLVLNLLKHIEREVEDIVIYILAEDLINRLERLYG